MKIHLNIIRGEIALRSYKAKNYICSVTDKQLEKAYNTKYYTINDIFDYFIHVCGVLYIDSFGCDRITDKGFRLLCKNRKAKSGAPGKEEKQCER